MTDTAADTKATAAALRQALRTMFPGTRFSVRMDRGSAYGWLNVSWVDGPTDADVRQVARRFESSRFSGMDDSYHQTGNREYSCCGVSTHRSISAKALATVVVDDARAEVRYLREEYHMDTEGIRRVLAGKRSFEAVRA